MQTAGTHLASTAPPPRGQAQNRPAATLSQIKFFHSMWIKFVCGRGQPRTSPGGGDSQEGARPPLREPQRACMRATAALRRLLASRSAPAPRRRTFPLSAGRLFASRSAQCGRAGHISAREARALLSVLSEEIPPGAQCAPLRLPHYGHFSMQISHFSYGNDLRNML